MTMINQDLYVILKKNFKPQSSEDPEWSRLLPVIGKLQYNGFNDMTAKNPFDTFAALESLKSVLLQEDLRHRLFPDLTKKQVQSELNKLTIEGPPRLSQLYSICASNMIDMLYKQEIWTADVIAYEIEKRLHQTPEHSDVILVNALTPIEASHKYSYYTVDANFGPLIGEKAQLLFKTQIQYQMDEANLEMVRFALQTNAKLDISSSDRKSLLKRVKDRINYLHSKPEANRLYQIIQTTNSEFELTEMQSSLQKAMDHPEQNNPYRNLHPSVNIELQNFIQQRIASGFSEDVDYYGQSILEEPDDFDDSSDEELDLSSISGSKDYHEKRQTFESKEEQELKSTSEWFDIYGKLITDSQTTGKDKQFVPVKETSSSPVSDVSTINSQFSENTEQTETSSYHGSQKSIGTQTIAKWPLKTGPKSGQKSAATGTANINFFLRKPAVNNGDTEAKPWVKSKKF